ncbi:MAG: hypothetical protein ACI4JB_06075 [Porcipelethomonas sp.]
MSEFNEINSQDNTAGNNLSEPASVTEPAAAAADYTGSTKNGSPEIVSGVEAVKKNPTKIIAIIIAAVVLLFGCCGAAYALIPQVKNTVKMLVNSPEEYYLWVEQENMEYVSDFISDLSEKTEDVNINSDVKVNLDSAAINKLMMDNGGTSLSELGISLPSEITITEKGSEIDGYIALNQAISAGDDELLTYNIYMKDGKYYYQIPTLSNSYLCMDSASMLSKAAEESGNELMSGFANMLTGAGEKESFISSDDLTMLITKYSDTLFTNITNVELEKNAECEADGVKAAYTKLKANIDEGTLFSFIKEALNLLKDDEIIIGICEDNFEIPKEEYQEEIDSILSEFGNMEISGGKTILVMNVYVDSMGNIVGRTFENAADSEETFSLGYLCTRDGNSYGFSAFVDADDERVSVDGNCTEDSDKFTGKASLSSADQEDVLGLTFKDFSADDDIITGSVTLGLSAFELDDMTIVFEEKDGKQVVSGDITSDGTKLGSFTAEASKEKPDSLVVFNDNETVYDIFDENQLSQYREGIDSEGLAKAICGVLGIPEDQIDEFVEGFESGFSNGLAGEVVTEAVDDFDYDADYDIAYEDVEYDLSKVKIQLDGKDIKLPGKVDSILDKVKFEEESIEAGDYGYGYTDDYSICISVENSSDKEMNAADCDITGLSIDKSSGLSISVDGIALGDDIQKAADKFGFELSDSEMGCLTINDADPEKYNYISICYYDGVITYFDINFFD